LQKHHAQELGGPGRVETVACEHAQQRPTLVSRSETAGHGGARAKVMVAGSAIVIAALFIVLASVAFETWPTADDYCNSVLVAQSGVAGALRWLFFEWSGRLVSGVPLYATFAWIDLPALHWVSVALVGLLAVAAYQAATLVAGEDRPLRWPLCAFIFAALVLGLYRLLGQAVLWSTGGIVYSVPLVVALLWFESVRRLSQGRDARGGELYGFILGIVTGNSIELVWPILIAYVVIVVPSRWNALAPLARRGLVLRIGGLAIGMLALIVAPGNYARAKVTPGSFALEPGYLLTQYFTMLKAIMQIAWPMVAIIIVTATAALLAWNQTRKIAKTSVEPSPLREAAAIAAGALLSIVPVLAVPAQFAPRNGFYLLIFALLAALVPLVACARHARWRAFAAPALLILAALGAAAISVPLLADASQSSAFRDRQAARDRALRELPQRSSVDAIVPPIGLWPVPRTLHFVEVEPDRSQWNNVCTAKYYGLRSIALEPKAR